MISEYDEVKEILIKHDVTRPGTDRIWFRCV